jgi:hypothetical protein
MLTGIKRKTPVPTTHHFRSDIRQSRGAEKTQVHFHLVFEDLDGPDDTFVPVGRVRIWNDALESVIYPKISTLLRKLGKECTHRGTVDRCRRPWLRAQLP